MNKINLTMLYDLSKGAFDNNEILKLECKTIWLFQDLSLSNIEFNDDCNVIEDFESLPF